MKRFIKDEYTSANFISYSRVTVNSKERYVQIVSTDTTWGKKGSKTKILKGPIRCGTEWRNSLELVESGQISLNSPKSEKSDTRKISKVQATFQVRSHKDVNFNGQLFPAIEVSFRPIEAEYTDELTQKIVFVDGLGVYQINDFILNRIDFIKENKGDN